MRPYVGNELFIFGSYAHNDKELVYPIFEKMLQLGYRIWFDVAIKGQTSYGEVIADRINESKYFIAFITKNYINSDYCKKELEFAERRKIKILPIFLEDVELNPWMDFILGGSQAIIKSKYHSDADFYNAIFASDDINVFLETDPKKILSEIESAKLINNCVPKEKIFTAKLTDSVFEVIEDAYNKNFGFIPIVDNNMCCVGVFALECWSKILIDNLSGRNNIKITNELTFKDLEEYINVNAKKIREVIFVDKDITVFDVKIKMAEVFKKEHKGVGVFLITENGLCNEPILGLLTPTGLLGRKI